MNTTEAPDFNRRRFFQVLGGGVLAVYLTDPLLAQERRGRRGGGDRPMEVSAWIHIGEDGTVQVFTGKTEVGQNIRTSLAQAVAEELEVPISSIRMVMADTDLVPFDAGTFGSRSTPDMALHLRKVAATAREALIDLAKTAWDAERDVLSATAGKVSHRDGRSISYAELAKGQKLLATVTNDVRLKPASDWKIAGTSVPKVDGRDFVTGQRSQAARHGIWQGVACAALRRETQVSG